MSVVKPQVTVYTSAARTATPTEFEVDTSDVRGLHLVIDVTTLAATPSVTPKIQGYSELGNDWYDLLVGAAITATGVTVLKIYPGIAVQANATASDVLPNKCRVQLTHADADSITYSVAALLMP
jgi:hypothetical protein